MIFIFYVGLIKLSSAQLNLNDIKRQATYPPTSGGTITSTKTSPTSSAESLSCNAGCQSDWIPYGGNCYKKIANSLTQSEAEAECVQLGSHLTSIESEAEALAIKRLVLDASLFQTDNLTSWLETSSQAWIGLSKTINGAWVWSDSSEVLFTNFVAGESTTSSSCTLINNTSSATWEPVKCTTTTFSFICKKAAEY